MLKPTGVVYCTQTLATQRSAVMEIIKPLLKFVTTIDFGHVQYERDVRALRRRRRR